MHGLATICQLKAKRGLFGGGEVWYEKKGRVSNQIRLKLMLLPIFVAASVMEG